MADKTTAEFENVEVQSRGASATPEPHMARTIPMDEPSIRECLAGLFNRIDPLDRTEESECKAAGKATDEADDILELDREEEDESAWDDDYLNILSRPARFYHLRASAAGRTFLDGDTIGCRKMCDDLLSKLDLPPLLRVELLMMLGRTFFDECDALLDLRRAFACFDHASTLCEEGKMRTRENHDSYGYDLYYLIFQKSDNLRSMIAESFDSTETVSSPPVTQHEPSGPARNP